MKRSASSAALLVLALTVACQDAPEPRTPAPPSAAQAPEAPAGPADAARAYYEAIRLGFVTGDTAPLTRLATPDCVSCQSVVAGITDERTAGTTYRGGEITAFETVSSTDIVGGVALVVRYSTNPFAVSAKGASPTSVPGASLARSRVTLQKNGSGWLVRELEPLSAR